MDTGWPILEALAVAWLSEHLDVGVSTDLPKDVETHHPDGFVRVARGPGSDDGITDEPLLDVEAFHPDRIKAARLAERARTAVHAMRGRLVTGELVDAVNTATGPNWVYYGPNVERYVASYRVAYRR